SPQVSTMPEGKPRKPPRQPDSDEAQVRLMTRAARLRTLDEEIARRLAEAADSGELASASFFGKPMPPDEGWEATPEALRMPFKILKDAGVVPAEVEWFHERARLRKALETAPLDERAGIERKLIEIEQKISLRLEALKVSSKL